MPNDIGLNAGVPNLAPWPGTVATADLNTEITNRTNADTALQTAINAIVTMKQLDAAADVANNLSGTTVALWTVAVVAGKTYSFRVMMIVDTGSNSGGVVPVIQRPSSNIQGHSHACTTSAAVLTDAYFGDSGNVATDLTLTTYVSFATTAGRAQGYITLDFQVVPAASGNVVIGFHPATNLQSITIKQGSTLITAHS